MVMFARTQSLHIKWTMMRLCCRSKHAAKRLLCTYRLVEDVEDVDGHEPWHVLSTSRRFCCGWSKLPPSPDSADRLCRPRRILRSGRGLLDVRGSECCLRSSEGLLDPLRDGLWWGDKSIGRRVWPCAHRCCPNELASSMLLLMFSKLFIVQNWVFVRENKCPESQQLWVVLTNYFASQATAETIETVQLSVTKKNQSFESQAVEAMICAVQCTCALLNLQCVSLDKNSSSPCFQDTAQNIC